MKHLFITTAVVALLGVSACQQASNTSNSNPVETEQAASSMPNKAVPKFSAKAFFQTTSYGLASSAGHAFGPSSGDVLITSDQSGVFNAYRLKPETGDIMALTLSLIHI